MNTQETVGLWSEEQYIEAIQTVIASLDAHHEAYVSHSDTGHTWTFSYGSVKVYIQLTGADEEDMFTVWSAVLSLPVNDELTLLRKLMALNWLETAEAQFALWEQQVVVVASRGVADLSVGEISRLITVVASIADQHDEALQTEFLS